MLLRIGCEVRTTTVGIMSCNCSKSAPERTGQFRHRTSAMIQHEASCVVSQASPAPKLSRKFLKRNRVSSRKQTVDWQTLNPEELDIHKGVVDIKPHLRSDLAAHLTESEIDHKHDCEASITTIPQGEISRRCANVSECVVELPTSSTQPEILCSSTLNSNEADTDQRILRATFEDTPGVDTVDIRNIPESVLNFERKVNKIRLEGRLGRKIDVKQLKVVFIDEHMVVVDKPPGVLSVPGNKRNLYSIAQAAFDAFGCESGRVDKMIVHRLDMDTSGLIVFARTEVSLRELHRMFRENEIKKRYEALICGRVDLVKDTIDLPLQRDHRHPPFMRVSTPTSEAAAKKVLADLHHAGWKRLIRKAPKPSKTELSVMGCEMLGCCPVTRVKLIPITGRTHQLRVHCAAIGHPILADKCYGFMGEGGPNGGFSETDMNELWPKRADLALQQQIYRHVGVENTELCLHATDLWLVHPLSGQPMLLQSSPMF